MSTVNLLARNCTLFTTTKALDEDAYRESLQRFVDFKIGPFVASGVSCRKLLPRCVARGRTS